MNYEEFGMDTPYKQRHYEMVVMNVTDMIEASYNRAYNGGERDSLRTARTVSETGGMSSQGMQMMGYPKPERKGFFKRIFGG